MLNHPLCSVILGKGGSAPRSFGRGFFAAAWVLAAMTLAGLVGPSRADQPAASGKVEFIDLANAGKFAELRKALGERYGATPPAEVGDLAKSLDSYEEHRQKHDAARKEAQAKALATMEEKAKEGKIDQALVRAVEAKQLSDDPDKASHEPRVVELAKQATVLAAKAEEESRWLEAMDFYRALDVLYDDHATHTAALRRCERHVRLLRIYAPRHLEKLYNERLKRLGEKERDLDLGEDPWKDVLKGVDLNMYIDALARAARRHITKPGFEPLLVGALDAVVVLAKTQDLSGEFPKLADPAKVKAFVDALAGLRASVVQRGATLGYLDATRVINQILEANKETLELPKDVLVFEMADGSMSRLDDFTAMIWPYEMDQFARNIDGSFSGVGIQLRVKPETGQLLVFSPLPDSPALRAGIRAEDLIVSVNGKDTAGWTLDRAVRTITGTEGTTVKLGIDRAGQKLEFELKRAKIKVESIRGWEVRQDGGWEYFIDKDRKIGYIRLSQFSKQTSDDLDTAMEQMKREGGINGLILDLRFNPGGLLSAAAEVCFRFINHGVIVSTVDGDKKQTGEISARPEKTYPKIPVVVLINGGSASASEIVSGALRDTARALVLGERSYGKGSVQDLFPVSSLSKAMLKLTTQYYRLPSGAIIHRLPNAKAWGVEPDLRVKVTTAATIKAMDLRQKADILRQNGEKIQGPSISAADILKEGADLQLEAALAVIKTDLLSKQAAAK